MFWLLKTSFKIKQVRYENVSEINQIRMHNCINFLFSIRQKVQVNECSVSNAYQHFFLDLHSLMKNETWVNHFTMPAFEVKWRLMSISCTYCSIFIEIKIAKGMSVGVNMLTREFCYSWLYNNTQHNNSGALVYDDHRRTLLKRLPTRGVHSSIFTRRRRFCGFQTALAFVRSNTTTSCRSYLDTIAGSDTD